VTKFQIEAEPSVEADVEASFDWYEGEQVGLGIEFLDELRARILEYWRAPLSTRN